MEGRRTALPAFKDASSSLLRKCWFCIFVANFVEALVEKCPIRQGLRQRLPTKFSAPLTFATAFDSSLPLCPGAGHYPKVVLLYTGVVLSAREDRCFGVPKGQSRISPAFQCWVGRR